MASNIGSIKLIPAKKQPSNCTWDQLFDSDTIPPPRPDGLDTEECLFLGETVVAASGDICKIGSWVFCRLHLVRNRIFPKSRTDRLSRAKESTSDNGQESTHHPTMVGRIFKIVVTKSHHEYIIVEAFHVSGSRDCRYGMPTMYARDDHDYPIIQPSVSYDFPSPRSPLIAFYQDISFVFNAQHDCEGGGCDYTTCNTSVQDRRATTKSEQRINHSAHNKFFINLHALHNAWRIREVLPRNLTQPMPYVDDREEFHHKMARKLQKNNPQKRARAKEKAKDAREQKKRSKQLVEESGNEQSGEEAHPAV